ncbi:hypothetical protein [Bacillus basilensis]|uniref:hypothetical protein n=1 Tax=Bacillus basilensis TaxID=3243721 RepID=UPI003D64B902
MMATYRGIKLTVSHQGNKPGIRINDKTMGKIVPEVNMKEQGKRIITKTSGKVLPQIMVENYGEREVRKTAGQEVSNPIYVIKGSRVKTKVMSTFLPIPFLKEGVRVPSGTFEGFFQQNQYISEEQIRNQALPRKEPLESPWKKRTYSKKNLN